ncbi:hypothetical protein T01_13559, partial [Trichinella spiralis]
LAFFILTQWVVSVQWNYFYKLEYLSLMVVRVSLNGLKRCTKIFGLMALPSIAPEICVASLIIGFDYCSVHVSTVISHVFQQFRFLQWVVSVQWNYFYELEYLSLMVVRVSLNGLKRCTKI